MTGGPITVIVIMALPVPPGTVALMVSRFAFVVAVVGVPEITQVLLRVSPAGSAWDAVQEVMGPPDEIGVCVAALETVSVTHFGE